MAIINKIRQKSGLAVGVITLGMILFLAGDSLFTSGGIGCSRDDGQMIGEINGRDIEYPEFEAELSKLTDSYAMQYGGAPDENVKVTLRQRAWEELIFRYAYRPMFDDIGLGVSNDEYNDMLWGDHIHPVIKQLFSNPQSGQFDKKVVIDFIQNFDNQPPQYQNIWTAVTESIKPDRARTKYFNLITKSVYTTKEEAKRAYTDQAATADAAYVFIPYSSISDSAVTVTDELLADYYQKNKAQYETTASGTIDYVLFPVKPSLADSMIVSKELEALKTRFSESQNDTIFVRDYSEGTNIPTYVNAGGIPNILSPDTLTAGAVFGPYPEGNYYKLIKIINVENDSVSSAKASHILFKTQGKSEEEKAAIKAKAEDVLNGIKSGEDFESAASLHGEDGTKEQGGDLGWFTEGAMVKPFNDAVFRAGKTGLLPNLVETEFGYHIIKVTATKTNKKFLIATVDREIIAGNETRDESFRAADQFSAENTDAAAFKASAESNPKLTLRSAELRKDDQSFDGISNGRSIVRWVFSEADKGDVSGVLEAEEGFVVASLTKTIEEGEEIFEPFREALEAKVRNRLKAEKIIQKLGAASADLAGIATKYGSDAAQGEANKVTLSGNIISGIGVEPEGVGIIFGTKPGEKSGFHAGENGVMIFKPSEITSAPEIADYGVYKSQSERQRVQRANILIDNTVKEAADIDDKRYKFY